MATSAVHYLRTEERGSVTIASVEAKKIERTEVDAFACELHLLMGRVLLNLSGVEYLHASAIHSLAGLHKRLKAGGDELRLCGIAAKQVIELLDRSRLKEYFTIHENEAAALENWTDSS